MCIMCEGASRAEYFDRLGQAIASHGWAVVAVEPSRHDDGWGYTVGLCEGFGHPEIIVRGASPPMAGRLLNQIGALVSTGHQFTSGDAIDLDGPVSGHVGLISVDPAHVSAGRFDAWFGYYARVGYAPRFSALQVMLPDGEHCWQHQVEVGRLDVPPSSLDGYSGNRTVRRARQRAIDRSTRKRRPPGRKR
ncbi:MAG: DUF4262 domain-containing protein [Acidimicrobiia bacterium]